MELLQEELYKLISSCSDNVYLDYLPTTDQSYNELDYLNNIYINYSLKNIEDLAYKDSIILEIEVVSSLINKIKVQSNAVEVDKLLSGLWIENCNSKVIRSNVYFMTFDDLENKQSMVTLSYKIYKY